VQSKRYEKGHGGRQRPESKSKKGGGEEKNPSEASCQKRRDKGKKGFGPRSPPVFPYVGGKSEKKTKKKKLTELKVGLFFPNQTGADRMGGKKPRAVNSKNGKKKKKKKGRYGSGAKGEGFVTRKGVKGDKKKGTVARKRNNGVEKERGPTTNRRREKKKGKRGDGPKNQRGGAGRRPRDGVVLEGDG